MTGAAPPRRRLTGVVAGLVAALLVLAAAIGATVAVRGDGVPLLGEDVPDNPFAERPQLVRADPRLDAAARQAAADGDLPRSDRLARLAEAPTGLWLLPELYPSADEVAAYVAELVADATADDAVALLVVYGITDRDCTGGLSSGGLPAGDYQSWVRAIAGAATPQHAVVVLEPDALVSAEECGLGETRVGQLAEAVATLAEAGVPTYVDAGHSAWRDADEVADLLTRVGVEEVRGFSVNVANYQPTTTEQAWADRLSAAVGGAHYVIDTGRNGAGAGRVGDWCNPPGQALGTEPGPVDDGANLDALLWVKPPWESDGTCQGGPDAGQLWLDRADQLAINAGW